MNTEQEFAFLKTCSSEDACKYLATKIRQARRAEKVSQEVFANRAGVALRTYKRFETHGQATLETFVRVLGAVGRIQYMFMIFPPPKSLAVKPNFEEKLKQARSNRQDVGSLGR
jgi:transcriptional regulator with XRE-family HTH domain